MNPVDQSDQKLSQSSCITVADLRTTSPGKYGRVPRGGSGGAQKRLQRIREALHLVNVSGDLSQAGKDRIGPRGIGGFPCSVKQIHEQCQRRFINGRHLHDSFREACQVSVSVPVNCCGHCLSAGRFRDRGQCTRCVTERGSLDLGRTVLFDDGDEGSVRPLEYRCSCIRLQR